jgi:hypothetical protein
VAHAKEVEVARLRALQEKIIDNRSALVSPGSLVWVGGWVGGNGGWVAGC